jgi:TusA-related sulfurtransferase
MTFVKTKLALEKLQPGETLTVTLNEGEPLENVPRSAMEEGYKILETTHIEGKVHRIVIEK